MFGGPLLGSSVRFIVFYRNLNGTALKPFYNKVHNFDDVKKKTPHVSMRNGSKYSLLLTELWFNADVYAEYVCRFDEYRNGDNVPVLQVFF